METGWDLDYVLEMPTSRLNMIVDSIVWHVRQREYRDNYRAAMIVAKIHNTNAKKSKTIKAEDVVGEPPERHYKPKIRDKWRQSKAEAMANFMKIVKRGKEAKRNGESRRGSNRTDPSN